jgi:hypothetical protein
LDANNNAPGAQRRAHEFASMEAPPMKVVRVLSTSALFFLLASAVPAFAQEGHEAAKPEAKPAQHEETAKPAARPEQAKPERQQEAKPEKQQAEAKPARQEPAAKPARQESEPKTAKQTPAPKPAKQQSEANTAKREPAAKPAKQENEARSAKQQPAAKPVKQENETKSAKQEQQAKPQQERGNAGGQQHAQRTPAEEQRQRAVPALRLSARGSGRIPDDRFRSNFGRGHEFRIGTPILVGGYSRFQYGGYSFGFIQPWPVGWYYTDDVYVDFIDGQYYLINPYYPGVQLGINVVL